MIALPAEGVIVTGRYQDWTAEDGVPVRTTVGYPRFWKGPSRGGPALQYVKEIAPFGVFKNDELDQDEKRMLYRQRLEENKELIVDRLGGLAAENPDTRLGLLCYENVAAGEVCHRRWFADWYEGRFGIAVPEFDREQILPFG